MTPPADISTRDIKQKPTKPSFFRSLRVESHWKCLALSLLLIGCLVLITWCKLSSSSELPHQLFEDRYRRGLNGGRAGGRGGDGGGEGGGGGMGGDGSACEDGYVYIPVAFMIIIYAVYLVECWNFRLRIRRIDHVGVEAVYAHIRAMTQAKPIVWWRAVCYHYTRRGRQVARYRNGDVFTTTQVYYERCNTHVGCAIFNYTRGGVKDVSKKLTGLADFPSATIHFTKRFSFASRQAERDYEDQRATFFADYERRDDYVETREGVDFVDVPFRDQLVAYLDSQHPPWYASPSLFWIASVLLGSWPVRILIQYKTAHVHYYVHKVFGFNYLEDGQESGSSSAASESGPEEHELPRAVTVDSLAIYGSNNTLVPSYSEALLMECYEPASAGTRTRPGPRAMHVVRPTPLPWKTNSLGRSLIDIRRLISNRHPNDVMRHENEATGLMVTTDGTRLQTNPAHRSAIPLMHGNRDTEQGTERFGRLRASLSNFFLQSGAAQRYRIRLSYDEQSASGDCGWWKRKRRKSYREALNFDLGSLSELQRTHHRGSSRTATSGFPALMDISSHGSRTRISPNRKKSRLRASASTPDNFSRASVASATKANLINDQLVRSLPSETSSSYFSCLSSGNERRQLELVTLRRSESTSVIVSASSNTQESTETSGFTPEVVTNNKIVCNSFTGNCSDIGIKEDLTSRKTAARHLDICPTNGATSKPLSNSRPTNKSADRPRLLFLDRVTSDVTDERQPTCGSGIPWTPSGVTLDQRVGKKDEVRQEDDVVDDRMSILTTSTYLSEQPPDTPDRKSAIRRKFCSIETTL